jgi:hypothetical protein
MVDEATKQYVDLIQAFLSGDLGAESFESRYLDTFKNQQAFLPEPVFAILDQLFGDVDAFCSDPSLRTEDDLDESQLRERSREALIRLQRVSMKPRG